MPSSNLHLGQFGSALRSTAAALVPWFHRLLKPGLTRLWQVRKEQLQLDWLCCRQKAPTASPTSKSSSKERHSAIHWFSSRRSSASPQSLRLSKRSAFRSITDLSLLNQWLQEGLQLRSYTFQLLKVAFNEEINWVSSSCTRTFTACATVVHYFAFVGQTFVRNGKISFNSTLFNLISFQYNFH